MVAVTEMVLERKIPNTLSGSQNPANRLTVIWQSCQRSSYLCNIFYV